MGAAEKVEAMRGGRIVTTAVRVIAIALVLTAQTAPAGPPDLKGRLAPFAIFDQPRAAPTIPIRDLEGNLSNLEQYRGKVVLLSFWATWCAPCVAELPSLERLQAKFSSDKFSVIALSIDHGGAEKVGLFLKQHGLENLDALDPGGETLRALHANGLPRTYLLDRQGRIIGSLTGPADWDSDAAVALIAHYLETT